MRTNASVVRDYLLCPRSYGCGGECCEREGSLAALDRLVAERDEAQDKVLAATDYIARAEAAEAEVQRLRHAADYAIHELGVPQDELTPAPVANAYRVLVEALNPKSAPDGFYSAAKEEG
jgi:hypothetical protein